MKSIPADYNIKLIELILDYVQFKRLPDFINIDTYTLIDLYYLSIKYSVWDLSGRIMNQIYVRSKCPCYAISVFELCGKNPDLCEIKKSALNTIIDRLFGGYYYYKCKSCGLKAYRYVKCVMDCAELICVKNERKLKCMNGHPAMTLPEPPTHITKEGICGVYEKIYDCGLITAGISDETLADIMRYLIMDKKN